MADETISRVPQPLTVGATDPGATVGADPDDPGALRAVAAGRYVLGEEIARGGMGAVFRARDTVLDREVAVKVLLGRYGPASATARRFADEAKIAGQLQHPAVPPVHDLGTLPDGRPFLAMKLIKGDTLDELLQKRADPSDDVGRFVAAFEQVCHAIGYAHAHGVIHRDLKPQNIMVGAFNEVQVMDWGLAKVLGARDPASGVREPTGTQIRSARDSASETQAGSLLGTPAYMAPEQAVGALGDVDARSDVFGLGGVLCAILTGRPPFAAADAESARQMAARGKLADALARLDGCGGDPELVELCKWCLEPEKADRPTDGREVAEAVAGLRAAAERRAREAERDRAAAAARAAEQRKRWRVQAVLAGVVLLVAAGAAGAGLWYQRSRELAALERAARRDRTAAGAGALLADARARAAEAWELTGHPAQMKARADLAVAALRQADDVIAAGDPTDAVKEDRSATAAAVEDAARHARLLSRAELALQEYARRPGGVFDGPRLGRELGAAFREFGLDPIAMPPDEFGRAVAASRIRGNLLGLLSEWFGRPETPDQIAPLHEAFRRAARACGGFLARWQERYDARDTRGLVALAASPEALEVGPDLIRYLGRVLRDARQYNATLGLLRRAAVRYPNDIWVHFDATHACWSVAPERAAEALRHAAAAVALRPDMSFLRSTLANAADRAGAADLAAREYARAFALDPDDLTVLLRVSRLRATGAGPNPTAVERELIAADPTGRAGPLLEAGRLYRQGDYAGAAAGYRAVIAAGRCAGEVHHQLGTALMLSGDHRAAAEAFDAAGALVPYGSHHHYWAGECRLRLGEWTAAAEAFRRALRYNTGRDAATYTGLGTALFRRGEYDDAAAAFANATRLGPKHAPAFDGLAAVRLRQGQPALALQAARTAVELDPCLAQARYDLGRALLATGDPAGAAGAFRAALRLDPEHAAAQAQLALALTAAAPPLPVAPPPREVRP